MATLSVCMIIRNEKDSLRRCLSSVQGIANEIIVVDTGSTDGSPRVAAEFGARVFFYQWGDDFSAARNYSLDQAGSEWILVLDGDEELDGKVLELINEKEGSPDIDAYLMTITQSDAKRHQPLALSTLQPRLFKNRQNYRYRRFIHEQMLDSLLDHDPSAVIRIAYNTAIIHHRHSGKCPTNQQRLNRNVKLIKQTLQQEGEERQRYMYLGREYFRHHKYGEALEYFLQAYVEEERQEALTTELMRSIITSLFLQGKTAEALTFANKAIGIATDPADLYYLKGVILQDLGHYVQAYQSVKEALSLLSPPPYRDAFYYQIKNSCLYLLGGLSEYLTDMDGALLFYYEALKNNPFLVDPLRRIIAILHPRKNPDFTATCLNRIFDLSDDNLQAEIAAIFYREGACQLTLDRINQLESHGPISEKTSLLKGLSLMRLRKYSEAKEVLQNITEDQRMNIKAQQYLLMYYWITGDYSTALECLQKIKDAGADASTIYVLDLLTGSPAIKTCVVQKKSAKLAKELVSLVVELGDRNQVDAAFFGLAPVLGERPSYLLAELYFNCEEYERARGEFLSLLEKGDDYPLIYYYLGKTCWMLGELDAALLNLRQAIDHGLDTPGIRREQARLYQEMAIRALKEGMHLFPEELGRQQIRKLEEDLIDVPGRETARNEN